MIYCLFKILTIAFKTSLAESFSKSSTFKILNFSLSSSDLTAEVVAPNKARPFLFKHDAIWDGPESFPTTK